MPFGFGGSSSRSRSTGRSQSSSFSFGESESGSVAGGVSRSADQSTSSQSVAFEDVFARLFGGAEGVAGNLDTSLLTEASNQLFAGGVDFLEGIGGDAGSAFLEDRLAGRNDVLEGQLGLLQSDIGDMFREELLPAITSEAVGGGQLGGGRQGVAQAGAVDAAAEAFTRGATELRTADQAQRDAIATGMADRSLEGTQTGLASLTGLLDLTRGGIDAQTLPMEFLAGILGDQSILGESQSSGFSSAEDFARAFSQAFDRSGSQSTSRTDSSSSSRSIGLSF